MWWFESKQDETKREVAAPMAQAWLLAMSGASVGTYGAQAAPARRAAPRAPAPAAALRPAALADGTPATLRELGIAPALARELEIALRAVGATRGDQVVSYTFRTAAKTQHPLQLESSDKTRR
jgi:hypothetical protein